MSYEPGNLVNSKLEQAEQIEMYWNSSLHQENMLEFSLASSTVVAKQCEYRAI